jgi:conjugative transfer region protein TrbK
MRAPRFNFRAVAQAVGFALVAVVLLATAMDLRGSEPSPRPPRMVIAPQTYPLMQDLTRCEALGTAAEQDPWCEAIWAEIQRRLFIDAPTDSSSRDAQTSDQAPSKPEGR